MKRYLGIIVCVALLAAAVAYFIKHQGDFKELLALGIAQITALVALNLATRVFVGARLKYLTAPFDVKMSLLEGTGLSALQAYGNVVAIKGGTAGIAYYLYARKNFSLDRFIAITGGGFVVTLLVVSMCGLMGLAFSAGGGLSLQVAGFFAALFCIALIFLFIPRLKLPAGKIADFLGKVSNGWETLRERRLNLVKLASVEILILASFAMRYYIAFRAFSQPIKLSQAFLLAPPAYLSLMANVTPAGMGVREPILAYMSNILGYTLKGGLGAAVLDSAVMVLLSLVTGPIAAAFLMPRGKAKDATA